MQMMWMMSREVQGSDSIDEIRGSDMKFIINVLKTGITKCHHAIVDSKIIIKISAIIFICMLAIENKIWSNQ